MSPENLPVVPADQRQPDGLDGGEEDVTMADNPDSDSDSDANSPPPKIEKWKEVIDAVIQATRDGYPGSPPFDGFGSPDPDAASPGDFQDYWRGVFARLHDRVVADAGIPEQLTSPPSTTFCITLFDEDTGPEDRPPCPCCLPEVKPSITLQNDAGVTKGDLVKGLAEFLYGVDLPSIYAERPSGEPGVSCVDPDVWEEGVLVHGTDWMVEPGGSDGERYVYSGWTEDRPLRIWLYCCTPDEFGPKAIMAKL